MANIAGNQIFGSLLRDRRQKVRLSQKEIVDEMNGATIGQRIAYSTYSRIESGEVAMSALQFEVFCRCIGKYCDPQSVSDDIFYEYRELIKELDKSGIKIISNSEAKKVGTMTSKELNIVIRTIRFNINTSKYFDRSEIFDRNTDRMKFNTTESRA